MGKVNHLSWVKKVFGKSVPEIAKTLGVEEEKLVELLSEADPSFWNNVKIKEISFSFDRSGRLKGYAKLLKNKGIPLSFRDGPSYEYKLYDHGLTRDEKKTKETEKYLRILDSLSAYSFAYHDKIEKGNPNAAEYERFILRDVMHDKEKIKRHIYSGMSYHPSTPYANKAIFLIHKDLGPVAAITSGEIGYKNEYVPYIDRLLVHPILSDKDFEKAIHNAEFEDVVDKKDADNLAVKMREWMEKNRNTKNKLSVGAILLLKAMVDMPEFHIDANHRTEGVMRKIEKKLGKTFFRKAEQPSGEGYHRFIFSRRIKR